MSACVCECACLCAGEGPKASPLSFPECLHSPFVFLHSGLSVTFLSLVSVSQLYVLPGGNRDGGEGFLGAGGLQKWEVWGMLWSCFYHLETWQEETPGETVEPLHTVSSSDGSRDFFWVLGGWEGSWLV